MEVEVEFIDEMINGYNRDKRAIVSMLQDIQDKYYYLPEDTLAYLSSAMEVPISLLYGFATFYRTFSLQPRGKHPISVCMGTACHVRGAGRIIEKIEREIDIKLGETSDDLLYSLDEVHCLGCCGLAPVVTVGDDLYGKITVTKIPGILKKYKTSKEEPVSQID
ncbi:hypothetical protein AMJ80_02090 [bacterium SM23_31]|nr:MAG: hypothetical protein AMJ80_02090 [bacterium SM23_31]